jgi:2-hydroxychromene-2-carboxylate isomerase
MPTPQLQIFFNFRSPYCYLASRSMFETFARFAIELDWRPLGSWDGRSAPDRAKKKLPIARQDVSRWCRRLGIPFKPPPVTTDPTAAGLGSIAAAQRGLLAPYVVGVMEQEWAHGRDIGEIEVLREVCARIGLDSAALGAAIESDDNKNLLEANWLLAQDLGVFGVPTFVIGDQIFWGNDRLDFLSEYLAELGIEKQAAALP